MAGFSEDVLAVLGPILAARNISGSNETGLLSVEELNAVVALLIERTTSAEKNIDFNWVFVTTIGILAMQAGFTLLEVGTVQKKNIKSVLLKNVCDLLFGKLVWWAVGFGLFSGENKYFSGHPWLFFISSASVQGFDDWPKYYITFIQQYAFAITSATIVSGAVMSRLRFEHYVWFSLVYTGVIYPICAHWAWNGFLGSDVGFVDFAGSGVVHMTGGIAALIFSAMLGPRVGRLEGKKIDNDETVTVVRHLPGSDPVTVVSGALLLYVAWFCFNAGSSAGLSNGAHIPACTAMMTTALGSAAGGSVATMYNLLLDDNHDVPVVVNGLLVGLVSITAGAASFDMWAAVLVGGLSALVYIPVSRTMLHRAHIDDPVDGFTIHGFGGAYGCLMVGCFEQERGLVYSGSFMQLRAQVIGIFVLGAFVAISVFLWILLLNWFTGGCIRLPYEQQLVGLDMTFHAGYDCPENDELTRKEKTLQEKQREELVKEAETRVRNRLRRSSSLGSASEILRATLNSKSSSNKVMAVPMTKRAVTPTHNDSRTSDTTTQLSKQEKTKETSGNDGSSGQDASTGGEAKEGETERATSDEAKSEETKDSTPTSLKSPRPTTG